MANISSVKELYVARSFLWDRTAPPPRILGISCLPFSLFFFLSDGRQQVEYLNIY